MAPPFVLLLVLGQPTSAQAPFPAASEPQFASAVFKRDSKYASFRPLGGPGPYFPERAARLHRSGEAVVDCAPGQDGALDDCRVVRETPNDFGFGFAATRMAKERWMILAEPVDAQPHTADGRVLVRVPFKAP